jgi:2',3'-cyclic-nucleotide 2'-phosphodiesterase (5'-nucleotidase family)
MKDSSINDQTRAASRRTFLKTGSLLGLGSALAPLHTMAGPATQLFSESTPAPAGEKKITILYTTDIHGQLLPHDEFFWENEKPVYRKRGGLAHLKTMIEHYRQQQPDHTILVDGGDYFHGSAVASLTEGEALIPIFNHLGYDLMLPGNWEVVYKKKKMLYDMGHATAAKICANMWHDSRDEFKGE